LAVAAAAIGAAQEPSELHVLPPLAPDLELGDEYLGPGEAVAPEEQAVPFDAQAVLPEPVDGKIVSLGEPAFDEPASGEVVVEGNHVAPLRPTTLDSALGYNSSSGRTSWIAGDDDRFGMLSFESLGTKPAGETWGIVGGWGFHFLDGPVITDMPPRLFDFAIGFQWRRWIRDGVGLDLVSRVGVFTDFEGSARKGVRFPGHAVAMFRTAPTREWLLGVDVLDRDDVSLLPVFGLRWQAYDELRLDLVFPRPAISVRLPDSDSWAYLRGEMGGGTWAIERADLTDDNATYRDLRLALGFEDRSDPSMGHAIEVAYVFGRELTYRSGNGDMELKEAVMVSFTGTY
jgi:hypothetical protein